MQSGGDRRSIAASGTSGVDFKMSIIHVRGAGARQKIKEAEEDHGKSAIDNAYLETLDATVEVT